MYLRKIPVAKIEKALAISESAGFDLTAAHFESHYFCGKDPVILVEALVTAKQLGVNTSFTQLAAIDLAGRNLNEVLLESTKQRTTRFDTFSPTRSDRIRGFTNDRSEVFAVVTVVYHLMPNELAFGFDFTRVHERLGAAVSVYINTATDLRSLQLQKPEHEAELRVLGVGMIAGFVSASIDYC